MTDREERLEELLAQFLKPMKGIPFEIVIRALCERQVLRFDASNTAQKEVLNALSSLAELAGTKAVSKNIIRPRPNEVGNDMEVYVLAAAKELGIDAAAPRTAGGAGKSTGYPDIRVMTAIGPVYLEVKTFARENHDTTQRSFYLSPSEDPKVTDDGYHLLVGYEMADLGVTGEKDERGRDLRAYCPAGVVLIDLYGLNGDMKFEYNSDNKRLYEKERLLFTKALGKE